MNQHPCLNYTSLADGSIFFAESNHKHLFIVLFYEILLGKESKLIVDFQEIASYTAVI